MLDHNSVRNALSFRLGPETIFNGTPLVTLQVVGMSTIRFAALEDLGAITQIYNEAVVNSVAAFDTEPKTLDEQKSWFANHGSRSPILVAELDDLIVGWASLSKWSDRCAYSDTAEISIYVRQGYRGKGIGKKLIDAILREVKKVRLHVVIARIAEGNDISMQLHLAVGFEYIGTMKEVGRKFGKFLDVHLLQYTFD